MVESLGKKFEKQLSIQFNEQHICFDRLKDDMSGFKGCGNIADFIVYYQRYLFYLECKSIRGNTFNFRLLRDIQYSGLLDKHKNFHDIFAGVLIWFIDRDVTVYVPIHVIWRDKEQGLKSINSLNISPECTIFSGTKKRVFFNYNLTNSFNNIIQTRLKYGY